ncbi:hypothetical protein CI238_10632 [Colletotrichum incanum]|uniref:Uncharacterized protein n=1 Tax=Colletotrichum incanum TaxID=1573173 RepID=A0A167BQ22_COLIC|nr:hypothetical protein CI238_10632 [Colletotrichum incanum]
MGAVKSLITIVSVASQAMAQTDAMGRPDGTGSMILVGRSTPRMLNSQSAEVINDAVVHPNATRSLKVPSFLDELNSNAAMDWTWRVNVTNVALPHLEGQIDNITSPHLISTSYDFLWPSGGSMSEALPSSNNAFCVTVLFRPQYPANVSGLYTEDKSNSTSCEPVLGPDCVAAVLRGSSRQSLTECREPVTSWNNIPECYNTLGWGPGSYTTLLSTLDINGKISSPFDMGTAVRNESTMRSSGEGFYGLSTGVIDGSMVSEMYLEATNQLHIMMIDSVNKETSRKDLLCMRVNATTDSGPAVTGGSDDTNVGSNDTSAAFPRDGAVWTTGIVFGAVSIALLA